MPFAERRTSIAAIAAHERVHAAILEEHAKRVAPDLVHGAARVARHLAEFESHFLIPAEDAPPPLQARWLTTAERWLAFYMSELRRLEALAGVQRIPEVAS
jgi:hypothetical protein